MTRQRVGSIVVAMAVLLVPMSARASDVGSLPAFPGAEGFGAGATGGRGGRVVIVDTLEPFGPGSLGEALAPESCEPRIIVFSVSGVIEVPGKHDLELLCGNLTIAGQTAPGAGITIHGRIDGFGADPSGNIIIRHLRLRPPPLTPDQGGEDGLGTRYDALQLSNNSNLMLDHLSLSWASDEVLDLYQFANDSTLQWSTIEVSNPQGQPEGPHNYAMIAGPDSPRVSVHHSLFAHHRARCPAMATGPAELINTVVYDCQDAFVHHNPASGEFHIAGNTFVGGPSHEEFTPLLLDDEEPGGASYWLSQNTIIGFDGFEGTVDDISETPFAEAAFVGADPDAVIEEPSDFSQESPGYVPVVTQVPSDAYDRVLDAAGAFPRDSVTLRTIDEVRQRTGSWDPNASTDLLEGLVSADPAADEDRDGIADTWETEHGLDATDGGDHTTIMPSGYTAIEQYVNELSDALVATEELALPTAPSVGEEDAAAANGTARANVSGTPSAGSAHASETLAWIALVVAALAVGMSGASLFLVNRRTEGRNTRPQ